MPGGQHCNAKCRTRCFARRGRGILNTVLCTDFSCVVLTADCWLLAAAESLPTHDAFSVGPGHHLPDGARLPPGSLQGGRTVSCTTALTRALRNARPITVLVVPVIDAAGSACATGFWPRPIRPTAATRSASTYLGDVVDVYNEGASSSSRPSRSRRTIRIKTDIVRGCARTGSAYRKSGGGDLSGFAGARCASLGAGAARQLGEEVGWDTLKAMP